jgi:UDP-sulfoquinovose synthase
MDIALKVKEAGRDLGIKVEIDHIPDPRVEAEQHYYNAKHSKLLDLGLQPRYLSDSLLDSLMNITLKYRDRVDTTVLLPQVNWRKPRNDRKFQTVMATGVSVGAASAFSASDGKRNKS